MFINPASALVSLTRLLSFPHLFEAHSRYQDSPPRKPMPKLVFFPLAAIYFKELLLAWNFGLRCLAAPLAPPDISDVTASRHFGTHSSKISSYWPNHLARGQIYA